MGLVSPTQVSDGTSMDAADVNTPVNQLAAVINGNIDAANLAADAVSTVKIPNDAVTDAKLVYGKVKSRQGGSSTDWTIAGTTTYDYSGTDTIVQVGCKAVNADPVTVTFPDAFSEKPAVFCQVATAVGPVNTFARVSSVGTTSFGVSCITDGGVANTAQTIFWFAVGKV